MSNMILFKPLPIAAVTDNLADPVNGLHRGVGDQNLLSPEPKEAYADGGGGYPRWIQIDLGSAQQVDSFLWGYLGPTPADVLGVYSVTGGTAAYTTTTYAANVAAAPSDVGAPMRQHAFLKLGAPVSARYLQFELLPSTGNNHTLGIFAVGLAFQPTWNREWDSGRLPVDTGAVTPLLGGGFGVGEGARKVAYQWTFGDLTDTDLAKLTDLVVDRGTTRPVIVVEDPDATTGLNERIHYGLFKSFERFGRQAPNLTRWSLQMEEWV